MFFQQSWWTFIFRGDFAWGPPEKSVSNQISETFSKKYKKPQKIWEIPLCQKTVEDSSILTSKSDSTRNFSLRACIYQHYLKFWLFAFFCIFHKKSIKNRFLGDLAKLDRFAQNQNYDICTSIYMSSKPKISRRFRFSSQNWAISSRFHDILNLSFSEVVFLCFLKKLLEIWFES